MTGIISIPSFHKVFLTLILTIIIGNLSAQSKKTYWQQEVKYSMDITMDVSTNRFTGTQKIRYKNNSPDVLTKAFFHLYLNAFQPNSVMDVRSRTISDPDSRIGDRILHLTDNEIGYQKIQKLTMNGAALNYEVNGTILEVQLSKSIRPGQTVTFDIQYEAQVPIQIRRNGRDNKEGIRYSMSQWYPKLCEYDRDGWHANPYIGREYYGVWGDFECNITIDAAYVVAASGVLQNAKEIGHGYAPEPKTKKQFLTWKFKADRVHDFVWAADPDFVHDVHTTKDGIILHAFYQDTHDFVENWKELLPIMDEAFTFTNGLLGKYPYPVYSFIQGGDGGMEYPMATLITGHRSLSSLVGVSVHELMHSWFQMLYGFNESLYYWMDEGFTSYAETKVIDHLKKKKLIPGQPVPNPYEQALKGYKNLVDRGFEEPLSTHADHFAYNTSYSISAYTKGEVFLYQLIYVIGKEAVERGLLDFYNQWKYKHPNDHDFVRVMEKASGIELDWYREYMVNSIKTIDYAIDTVVTNANATGIELRRIGLMPMPVDIAVKLTTGQTQLYTIPLDLMRGSKNTTVYQLQPDWNWVDPTYFLEVPYPTSQIETITIDPDHGSADMNRDNDVWPKPATPTE